LIRASNVNSLGEIGSIMTARAVCESCHMAQGNDRAGRNDWAAPKPL